MAQQDSETGPQGKAEETMAKRVAEAQLKKASAEPAARVAGDDAAPGEASASKTPADAPPRGRLAKTLLYCLLTLVLGIGGLGLVSTQFRDSDPHLHAIAEEIDSAVSSPQNYFATLNKRFEAWLAEDAPAAQRRQTARRLAETPAPAPKSETKSETVAKPVEPAPVIAPPAKIAEASAPVAAERGEEMQALSRRVDQLEESTREALKAAREARAAADKPGAAPAQNEGTYGDALEGRIDELASEITKLREQLNSPKNETRAEPQPAEAHAAQPTKGGGAAEIVVVEQSLLREMERGKPYAAEQAALAALGADPERLAVLAPFADTGAASASDLRQAWFPISRRLLGLDVSLSELSFSERLWRELASLVRIRVKNDAGDLIAVQSSKIDVALNRDDFDAAVEAFDKLPDNARDAAKDFGETLHKRRDAGKAAQALLTDAIAAIGRKN